MLLSNRIYQAMGPQSGRREPKGGQEGPKDGAKGAQGVAKEVQGGPKGVPRDANELSMKSLETFMSSS